MMFRTLLAKEVRESLRTSRFLITMAVFFITGLISPLLAKYTPELLRNLPDIPAGLADMIPEPTLNDAIAQYVKNISQFGVLLVIVLYMGAVAQEKERGTAAMLLVKPVRRGMVVLSKWFVGVGTIFVSMVLAGISCALYTTLLFESPPIGEYLQLNALVALFLIVYLSITLLASTLARTQSTAAVLAFAGLALMLILGAIPRINEYMPAKLLNWGGSLITGGSESSPGALFVALVIIFATTTYACLHFERQEI